MYGRQRHYTKANPLVDANVGSSIGSHSDYEVNECTHGKSKLDGVER
jgi:hypothetical protein